MPFVPEGTQWTDADVRVDRSPHPPSEPRDQEGQQPSVSEFRALEQRFRQLGERFLGKTASSVMWLRHDRNSSHLQLPGKLGPDISEVLGRATVDNVNGDLICFDKPSAMAA